MKNSIISFSLFNIELNIYLCNRRPRFILILERFLKMATHSLCSSLSIFSLSLSYAYILVIAVIIIYVCRCNNNLPRIGLRALHIQSALDPITKCISRIIFIPINHNNYYIGINFDLHSIFFRIRLARSQRGMHFVITSSTARGVYRCNRLHLL